MIRRMCDWMVENLGPDCPLHFSRFHPQHKLTHLPPTPIDVLVVQYSRSPLAKLYRMTAKKRGIQRMIFCCCCAWGSADLGIML